MTSNRGSDARFGSGHGSRAVRDVAVAESRITGTM